MTFFIVPPFKAAKRPMFCAYFASPPYVDFTISEASIKRFFMVNPCPSNIPPYEGVPFPAEMGINSLPCKSIDCINFALVFCEAVLVFVISHENHANFSGVSIS